VDRDDVIAPKFSSIHLRADAIDALTAIGEAAASSTAPLIQWALTCPGHSDEYVGIAILADMWPVVAKEHLAELKTVLICAHLLPQLRLV
jgi:hypothetical protein